MGNNPAFINVSSVSSFINHPSLDQIILSPLPHTTRPILISHPKETLQDTKYTKDIPK
jgi:hypothetical protein